MTALLKTGTSHAYVNWGRWVADCSHAYCDAAVEFNSVRPPIFPIFAGGFQCFECGYNTEVIWPEPRKVAGIERLLSLRPHPKTMNWLPGETLTELQYENGLHGVYDYLKNLELDPNISPMVVTDDEILADNMPLPPLMGRSMLAVER